MTDVLSLKPYDGMPCFCGGVVIEVEREHAWKYKAHVCSWCGGMYTNSGKYIPPRSGWEIPKLTTEEISRATELRRTNQRQR